jgi:hypothetical protein
MENTELTEPLALRIGLRFASVVRAIEGYPAALFSAAIGLLGGVGCAGIFGSKELSPWQTAASVVWAIGYVVIDVPYIFGVLMIADQNE